MFIYALLVFVKPFQVSHYFQPVHMFIYSEPFAIKNKFNYSISFIVSPLRFYLQAQFSLILFYKLNLIFKNFSKVGKA